MAKASSAVIGNAAAVCHFEESLMQERSAKTSIQKVGRSPPLYLGCVLVPEFTQCNPIGSRGPCGVELLELTRLRCWKQSVGADPEQGSVNCVGDLAYRHVATSEVIKREAVLAVAQQATRVCVSGMGDKFVAKISNVLPPALRENAF